MGKSGVFDWQILDFEDIVAVMRFFFFSLELVGII